MTMKKITLVTLDSQKICEAVYAHIHGFAMNESWQYFVVGDQKVYCTDFYPEDFSPNANDFCNEYYEEYLDRYGICNTDENYHEFVLSVREQYRSVLSQYNTQSRSVLSQYNTQSTDEIKIQFV